MFPVRHISERRVPKGRRIGKVWPWIKQPKLWGMFIRILCTKIWQKVLRKDFIIYPAKTTQAPLCEFFCDYGWFPLLDKLCSDLTKLIEESGLPEEDKAIPVDQVKEKFGGLRYYLGSVHEDLFDKAYELVSKAERDSFSICETCSAPGVLRSGNWLKVRCDKCQDEYEQEAMRIRKKQIEIRSQFMERLNGKEKV